MVKKFDRDVEARRIQRPGRLIASGLALALAISGAFLIGRVVPAPSTQAIKQAQEPIAVWAEVKRQVVDSRTTFAGKVAAAAVTLIQPEGGREGVVVRQTLTAGGTAVAGQLAGNISGQPYWFLTGPLPLYRDLQLGDTGDDVAAFQVALANAGLPVKQTGEVDRATLAAVQSLYLGANLKPPAGPRIAFAQFVALPAGENIVVSAAPMGAHLDAETALAVLRVKANHITFRADTITAASLVQGEKLTVRLGSATFEATVASIGAFAAAGEAEVAGREVTLSGDNAALNQAPDGTSVTIFGPGQTEPALAVPVAAVRQNAAGAYVLRRGSNGRDEEVAVQIDRSGAGWAAVGATKLQVGDQVRVS
ncbi:MAG TPA: hypothetical protein VFU07_06305 [Candidatus Lumbricidophila sp.]|nr:hypothetical protein [Candidatus Lumbricidophila sp.]